MDPNGWDDPTIRITSENGLDCDAGIWPSASGVKTESSTVINIKQEAESLQTVETQHSTGAEKITLALVKSEYQMQTNYWNSATNPKIECDAEESFDYEDDDDDDENDECDDDDINDCNNEDINNDRNDQNDVDWEYDSNSDSSVNDDTDMDYVPPKDSVKNKKPRKFKGNSNRPFYQKRRYFFEPYVVRFCPFCGIEFDSLTEWETHTNTEHNLSIEDGSNYTYLNKSKARCNQCNALVFRKVSNLKSHIFLHLPYTKIFKCRLCSWAAPKDSQVITHIELRHFDVVGKELTPLMDGNSTYKCAYCGKYVGDVLVLSNHIQTEHSEIYEHKVLHVCPLCGYQFEMEQDLKQHLDSQHEFHSLAGLAIERIQLQLQDTNSTQECKMMFRCLSCNLLFESNTPFSKFEEHAFSHAPYKRFKCRYCEFNEPRKASVITHTCNSLFKELERNPMFANLMSTIYKNTIPKKLQQQESSVVTDLSDKLHVCPSCGENFDDQILWDRHLMLVHNFDKFEALNVKIESFEHGIIKYFCTICKKHFNTNNRSNIRVHAFYHMPHKIYKCKHCQASLNALGRCPCKTNNLNKAFIFVCPKCSMEFPSKKNWQRHTNRVHHLHKPTGLNFFKAVSETDKSATYKCGDCDEVIKESSTMLPRMFLHASVMHMPYKCYKCINCREQCADTDGMMEHANSCKMKNAKMDDKVECSLFAKCQCYVCGNLADSEDSLMKHFHEAHQLNNTEQLRILWHCTVCEIICNTENDLQTHIRTNHINVKPTEAASDLLIFHCPACEVQFRTQLEWQTHINEQHALNTLEGLRLEDLGTKCKCLDCGLIVKENPHVKLKHRMRHLTYNPYKCSKCLNSYSNLTYTLKHALNCDGTKTATTSEKRKPRILQSAKDKAIQNIETLKSVQKKSKKSDKEDKPNSMDDKTNSSNKKNGKFHKYWEHFSYACPECNKPFLSRNDWHSHLTVEHDFFSEKNINITPLPREMGRVARCNGCGVNVYGGLLQYHRHKLTHMQYQAFVCKICTHRSRSQNVLVDHIHRKHFTPGEFKCVFCHVILNTSYKLVVHTKAEHSDAEWPDNACQVCMKLLRDPNCLRIHMKTHEYDRETFECRFCERKYYSVNERRLHWIQNHPAEYAENNHSEEIKSVEKVAKAKKPTKKQQKKKTVAQSDQDFESDSSSDLIVLARLLPNTRRITNETDTLEANEKNEVLDININDREMNDSTHIMNCETESCSGLENYENTNNAINIKLEPEWPCPADLVQTEEMEESIFKIEVSEYELHTNNLDWTANKADNTDENDYLVDNDSDHDEDDDYCSTDQEKNKNQNLVQSENKRKRNACRKEKYELFRQKRKYLDSYILRACPYCNIEFESFTDWSTHLDDVHNHSKKEETHFLYTDDGKAKCTECGTIFKLNNLDSLKSHILSHLPHKNIYKCKLCSLPNLTQFAMLNHIERHHFDVVGEALSVLKPTNANICAYCGKYVGLMRMIAVHIRKEHFNIYEKKLCYVCPFCGEQFDKEKCQKEHAKCKHQPDTHEGLSFELLANQEDEEKIKKKYRCLKCNVQISGRFHVFTHHALTHLPHKCFKCRYCDYTHDIKWKVVKHTCEDLLRDIENKPNLTALTKHSNYKKPITIDITNKLFVCPKCGESFEEQSVREAHFIKVHNFDKIESLNIKTTTSENGESVISCTICEKKFTKSNLKNFKTHAFGHMTYKLYKCKLCEAQLRSMVACPCKLKKEPNKNLYEKTEDYMDDRKMNDPTQSMSCATNSSSELENSLINNNPIEIKTEPEWSCQADSEPPEQMMDTNFQIEKSEYELQSNDFDWTKEDDTEDDDDCDDESDYSDEDDEYILDSNPNVSRKHKRKSSKGNSKKQCDDFKSKRKYLCSYMLRTCPYCNIAFESLRSWDTHLDEVHNHTSKQKTKFTFTADHRKAKCTECKLTILGVRRNILRSHSLLHLPYKNNFKCKLCSITKRHDYSLIDHIERQHFDVVGEALSAFSDKNKSSICAYCGKYVGILRMVSRHIQNEHADIYEQKLWYICPCCGEQFSNEKCHKEHLHNEHKFDTLGGLGFEIIDEEDTTDNKKKYRCLKCKAQLPDKFYMLPYHALAHYTLKCYKCRYCDYTQDQKWKVIKHTCDDLLLHIKNDPNTTTKTSPNLKPPKLKFDLTNKLFVCPKCGEIFEEKSLQEEHFVKVHNFDDNESLNIETITTEDGKSFSRCMICERKFTKCHIYNFQTHAFNHMPYKLYKCKLCKEPLSSLVTCPCELKKGSGAAILYVCPRCGKESVTRASWNTHMRQVHNLRQPSSLGFSKTVSKENETAIYKCSDCGEIIQESDPQSAEFMFKHATIEHMPFKCYKCDRCGETNDSHDIMLQHASNCKFKLNRITAEDEAACSLIAKCQCHVCGHLAESEELIVSHLSHDHQLEIVENHIFTWFCTECEFKYDTREQLVEHALDIHLKTKSLQLCYNFLCFFCPVCNKKFQTKTEWKAHIVKEHGLNKDKNRNIEVIGNKWKCLVCNNVYKNTFLQKLYHCIKHLPYKSFKCLICSATFIDNNTARIHVTGCSRKPKATKSIKRKLSKVDADQTDSHQVECIKEKEKKKKSKQPNAKKLKDDQFDPLEIDKSNVQNFSPTRMAISTLKTYAWNKYCKYMIYACPECNMPFDTSEEWHLHISTQHDFFSEERLNTSPMPGVKTKRICDECGVTVHGSTYHSQRHKLTHMPYESFICKLCNHRSKTNNVLIYHIERRHFTPGQYKCVICPLVFETYIDLYEHTNAEHSDAEWPENACRICMKEFTSKAIAKEHMKTHEFNRTKHDCGLCNRKYYHPIERKKHWKQSHPLEYESLVNEEKKNLVVEKKPVKQKKTKKYKKKKIIAESDEDSWSDSVVLSKLKLNEGKNTKNTRAKRIKEEPQSEVNNVDTLLVKDEPGSSDVIASTSLRTSKRYSKNKTKKATNKEKSKDEAKYEEPLFSNELIIKNEARSDDDDTKYEFVAV